jgi:Fe-Mn family superoxide dismutase
MGSKGWALLGYDPRGEELFLSLVDSHDCSVPLIYPILALDVWEHAYYIDYKSKKEEYVDALLDDINWKQVSENLDKHLK